jgi:phospholipid transport system transporter-binding protein
MTSLCIDDQPAIGGFTASERGWLFAGALTLDDAAGVLAAANAMPLPANGVIDMRGMMHADSSALAVVIALRRRGAAEGRKLSVVGLPPSLHSLAVVYGVEDLVQEGPA